MSAAAKKKKGASVRETQDRLPGLDERGRLPGLVDHVVVVGNRRWRRVTAPKVWRPTEIGDTIVGRFGGTRERDGMYGPYSVAVFVEDDYGLVHIMSGCVITDLVSSISAGTLCRVVFMGSKPCSDPDHAYRDFELFTIA